MTCSKKTTSIKCLINAKEKKILQHTNTKINVT